MNLACRESIQCSIVLVLTDTLYLSIFDPKVQKIWKVWKMCTSEVTLNKVFPTWLETKSSGGGLHDVRLTFGGCILERSILAISVNVWLIGRQGKHRASFLLQFLWKPMEIIKYNSSDWDHRVIRRVLSEHGAIIRRAFFSETSSFALILHKKSSFLPIFWV